MSLEEEFNNLDALEACEHTYFTPIHDYDYSFLPTPPELWVAGIDNVDGS
jgi:hypothetical protein